MTKNEKKRKQKRRQRRRKEEGKKMVKKKVKRWQCWLLDTRSKDGARPINEDLRYNQKSILSGTVSKGKGTLDNVNGLMPWRIWLSWR